MNDLRAAYQYLKASAFHDIKLPTRIRLFRKHLRLAWGYFTCPNTIDIDSSIKTGDKLLKVLAHEMCHAALEQNAACDHHEHDANFHALAEIICDRMGWKVREF